MAILRYGSTVERCQYRRINNQAATVVKASPCYLKCIVINTPAANGVIKVWDDVSGGALSHQVSVHTQPASLLDSGSRSIEFDIALQNGLVIETQVADQDITVVFQ